MVMSSFGQSPPTPERRAAMRDTVHRPGKLLDGRHAWPCTIVDISATGLRITGVRGLPASSEVTVVDMSTGVGHQARVVWAKEIQAGLKLIQSRELRGLVPQAFQAAKSIWDNHRHHSNP